MRVEHIGEPSKADLVSVTYSKNGKPIAVKARTVVMAGGGWITKHVVRDLDETRKNVYDHSSTPPYMTVNVAVRNWRFLYNLGISSAQWFDGFGRYVNVRKSALFGVDTDFVGPDLPTVLTFFVDFTKPGLAAASAGATGTCGNAIHPVRRLRTPNAGADDGDVCAVQVSTPNAISRES